MLSVFAVPCHLIHLVLLRGYRVETAYEYLSITAKKTIATNARNLDSFFQASEVHSHQNSIFAPYLCNEALSIFKRINLMTKRIDITK